MFVPSFVKIGEWFRCFDGLHAESMVISGACFLADFSFKKVKVVGFSDHPALCAFLFKFLNVIGDLQILE
jgi:hypothetical protein